MSKKVYKVMVKIGRPNDPLDDPLDCEYSGRYHSTKWEAEIELTRAKKEYQLAWIKEEVIE